MRDQSAHYRGLAKKPCVCAGCNKLRVGLFNGKVLAAAMSCVVHQKQAQLPALRALRCEELRPAVQRSWAPALSGRNPQRSSELSCPLRCTRSRASGAGCGPLAAAAAPGDCGRDMAAPGSIYRSSEAPEPPRRRCLPGPAPPRTPTSRTCAALGSLGTLRRMISATSVASPISPPVR